SNLGSGTSSLTIGSGASIQVNFSGPNSSLYISSSFSSILQSTGATLSYVASSSGDQLAVQVQADPNSANAQTIGLSGTTTGSVQDLENAATTTLVSFSGI